MTKITSGYASIPGAYSEMVQTNGEIRPHWLTMLNELDACGTEEIDIRWQRAQRMIQQNGVTYNLYGDGEKVSRPWVLDPVPLIIAHDEWQTLAAGLIQRTEVINRTLRDLYSQQNLLKGNVLPSELLFSNPAFLRSCCQIKPPDDQYITLHAVDLARSPEGKWCVVKDMTQSPSGTGYALENRLVVSSTFPTMYQKSEIERLAPFFSALKENLTNLARAKTRSPRIVVLTPGPYSASYFEHAYMARYLGFSLVQANDLSVRKNKVFLKTLSGLRKVDVIFRRQSDDSCDPLELDSQSALGIPGLVQAAASGEVVIANSLGSGLAETPALLPFFPGLCHQLLGEAPKLASLHTLWCGQPEERELVLAQFDRWVIKRAFSPRPKTSIFVQTLSEPERIKLAAEIRAAPEQYIAQENMFLSTSPCWQDGKLISRHNILRAFIVATSHGWKVMPGGLVRTSLQPDSTIVSMENGGGSKDAWVQAAGWVQPFSLLPRANQEIAPSRTDENLSSRLADNLFWLGRYVQRADMQARLIRTILRHLIEETHPEESPELTELLNTLAVVMQQPLPEQTQREPHAQADETRKYLYGLITARDMPGNLRSSLTSASQIGSVVRERISIDTWRILDNMNRELENTPHCEDPTFALDMLDRLLMPLAAFSGLSSESMTHGYGWRFMDMGFRMERATMSAEILRELLAQPAPDETPILEAMLEVANSSITYRARYINQVNVVPLLDLLVSDDSNPRSIAYQLVLIQQHIHALSHLPTCNTLEEQTLASQLILRVNQYDLHQAVTTDANGFRPTLCHFMDFIIEQIYDLSNRITLRYLAHSQPTSRLAATVGIKPTEDTL